MPLKTTTIGAYPKPDYIKTENWYNVKLKRASAVTVGYEEVLETVHASSVEDLDRATQNAVIEQVEIGIDIPTDGEIRREHYIYYHLRHIQGYDFLNLTEEKMRNGSWIAKVPTLRSTIVTNNKPFLVRDWQIAQAVTDKPVKITLPGPMTIMDSTVDVYYQDEKKLGRVLADTLNVEIKRLANAGCKWIQVDEPVFARDPDMASGFGLECLERCFHGVPETTVKSIHICCGYPMELDQEDFSKADKDAYITIANALEESCINAVSLEDAHCHNDLAFLEHFKTTSIMLGVIDIAKSRVEEVDEIRERLKVALNHIEPERLMVAPDCGLTMLPHDLATAKLKNMVVAANAL